MLRNGFTQTLHMNYANNLRKFTHTLRKYVYTSITQVFYVYAIMLRRFYADFTQIYYAMFTHITQHYANNLRRYYANNLRRALRRLRNHYANKLRKCDYANTHNFITQITQMPIFVTQKFWSLRNGQLADVGYKSYNLYNLIIKPCTNSQRFVQGLTQDFKHVVQQIVQREVQYLHARCTTFH